MIYVQLGPTGLVISACNVYDTPSSIPDGLEVFPLKIPLDYVLRYGKNPTTQEFEQIPDKPHDWYVVWDWATKQWLPDLAAVLSARKAEIDAERNRRTLLPATYNNAPFDADLVSRERITGLLARIQRGDGLTVGWMGWRDFNNNMHWAADDAATVFIHLAGLSSVIENREQAFLITAWTHKAMINALSSIEEIVNYNINSNWPE